MPIGDFFVLHPRQFVLGETIEWVHLPVDLSAYVLGHSSWGRDGLVIATATGVHPGYSGIITLELSNIGEISLSLSGCDDSAAFYPAGSSRDYCRRPVALWRVVLPKDGQRGSQGHGHDPEISAA